MDDSEYEKYNREMFNEEKKASMQDPNIDMMNSNLTNSEANIIQEQLSLDSDLERLYHLLRGDEVEIVEGERRWRPATKKETIILSEEGVNRLMPIITSYMNRNLLLSNYDEDTINCKMEDFATDLADLVFMNYEHFFLFPTLEECQEEFNKKISKKVELRKFALEVLGKEYNTDIIKSGVMQEIEDRIDNEMKCIREQKIKDKLKYFEIIIRQIQDNIHSTYLRALFGAERRTLREHIHVNENRGYNPPTGKNKQQSGVSSWFRKG